MTGENYRIPAIGMIMLGVSSLENSLAFYEGKLGVRLRQRVPGFAFLETGAVTLVLSEPLAKNVSHLNGALEVIFSVDDVRAHHESLRSRGITFVQDPHNVAGPMWAANFRDPDGHLLTLFGPEHKAT
jgi:catechol 2,3-dioxygenase-like lactoylglutathione lyase family enzyme